MKAKVFALLFVLVLLCPTVLSVAAEAKTLISVQNFGLRYDFVSDGTVRIWTSATSSYELWFTLGGQSLSALRSADQKGNTVYLVYVQSHGQDEYYVSVTWQFSETSPLAKWTAAGEWFQSSTFSCRINLKDLAATLALKNGDTRAEFGKLFFDWADTVTAGVAPQEHGKSGNVFSAVWKVDQKFSLDPTIGQTEGVATAQQVSWSYVDSGIGAWWRLDEGTGGTSSDSSGHGNTFTLYNSAWVDGKFGKAILCNGSSSGAYASHSSYLSPSNVTVAAWVNIRSFSSWAYQTIACKGYTYYVVYCLYVNSDHKLSFAARIGGTDYDVAGTTVLQPNTWYRAVGAFNGTCLAVYLNGECENSLAQSGSLSTNDQSFKIGWGWFGGTQDSFNGTIDEVSVYDRGLSGSEIHDDYVRTWTSSGYYWANNAADTNYRYNFSFAFPSASSTRVLSCTFPKGHSITNVTCAATGTALYAANYTVGAFNSTHNYVQMTDSVIAVYGNSFILFTHATCGVYDVRLEYNPPSSHLQYVSPAQSVRVAVQLKDPYGAAINPQTQIRLWRDPADLVFQGVGTTWALGVRGSAVSLNGSGYLEASSSLLNFYSDQLTLEAWVKPSSNGGYVLCNGPVYVGLYLDGGRVGFYVGHSNSLCSYFTVTGATTLALNCWTHLMGVYNGTHLQVYVNGTLDGTMAVTDERWMFQSSYGFDVGCSSFSKSGKFNGLIDEARVWNRALNSTERAYSFSNFAPLNSTGLIARWDFDEGSGTAACDTSNVVLDYTGTPSSGWLNCTCTTPTPLRKYYLQANCSGDYAGVSCRTVYVVGVIISGMAVNDSRLNVGSFMTLSGLAYTVYDATATAMPSGTIAVCGASSYAVSSGSWSGTVSQSTVASYDFWVGSVTNGAGVNAVSGSGCTTRFYDVKDREDGVGGNCQTSVSAVWDRVNVTLSSTHTSQDNNQEVTISWVLVYAYDGSPVSDFNLTVARDGVPWFIAQNELNRADEGSDVTRQYTATAVSEGAYGLTAFLTNSVSVEWKKSSGGGGGDGSDGSFAQPEELETVNPAVWSQTQTFGLAVVGTILVAAFALEKRGGRQQWKRREDKGNPEWKQRKEKEVNWKHKHPYNK